MTQKEADQKVQEYSVAVVKQMGRGLIIVVIIIVLLAVAFATCLYLMQ